MSKRPVNLLIEDILEAIEKVQRYTADLTLEAFREDDKTIDAVVRNLEIIGEAANRVPTDFRSEHGEIEWKKIIGLRHRIVHEYFGVDLDIVWHIIDHDVPALKKALKAIDVGLKP
jgi:uncharacterized protein with HEPN domain